jgi:peptidoglycan/xylan/chitin deacetylase (PgdA/CDA1 family)
VNTRRLLVEEGGFRYDSDAYDDDLPYLVQVGGRPHVVIPYSFDTNDMRFQAGGGFTLAGDFATYVTDAFDWLWREGERAPKLMSIGLHLRIVGRPGRIGALERILEHVTARDGVWIARRDTIARHWRALHGLSP